MNATEHLTRTLHSSSEDVYDLPVGWSFVTGSRGGAAIRDDRKYRVELSGPHGRWVLLVRNSRNRYTYAMQANGKSRGRFETAAAAIAMVPAGR